MVTDNTWLSTSSRYSLESCYISPLFPVGSQSSVKTSARASMLSRLGAVGSSAPGKEACGQPEIKATAQTVSVALQSIINTLKANTALTPCVNFVGGVVHFHESNFICGLLIQVIPAVFRMWQQVVALTSIGRAYDVYRDQVVQ